MVQNPALIFSQHWNIYQKIIAHNYMRHAELGKKTAFIVNQYPQKKLHILDIGCGDASALLSVLQPTVIASYTGFDLSSATLQLAAEKLTAQNVPHALKEGNMMELIEQEENQFDIIYSSFAIHHLQDDEKRKLLLACLDRLLPEGKMIYIDIFREHISRNEYINNYLSFIETDWPLLTANEKQLVHEHITTYDFPSDLEETIASVHSLGFSVSEKYQPDHSHAMLVLSK
jgi:ubiquinone/menaquinone biosynthesis C-methylase UbiE